VEDGEEEEEEKRRTCWRALTARRTPMMVCSRVKTVSMETSLFRL
jgi:hypothetical protein